MAPTGRGGAAYVRSLVPRLDRAGWILQTGGLVNSIGTGLVYPFTIIYLHNVRGFSLGSAGAIVALFGGVGFLLTPVAGAAIDRIGARSALAISLVLLATGYGLFPTIRSLWEALVFMTVAGAGNALFWPSQQTLIAGTSQGAVRAAAFSLRAITQNLGMAIGGIGGGLIATTTSPRSFTVLFLADAATFLAYLVLLPAVPPLTKLDAGAGIGGGYRAVLRDRIFVGVIALNVVFVAAAYAQFDVTLPAFAKNTAGLNEREIGAIFFVNMLVVALAQLPVTRFLEGRQRMRALAGATVLWSAAFVLVLVTGMWLAGAAAAALLAFATVIFTFGETLHGPSQSALAADLAPEHLRGRYMSLVTNSYALGFTIGPAAGGVLLAASPSAPWLVSIVVLALAGMAMLMLEQQAPESARVAPVGNSGA
jgi:MFS family permease